MGTVLKLRKNQIIPTPGGVAAKKFLFHGKKNICGDRIRMARLGKRLSQTDLARLLQLEGVPMERDVISRMEMGDRLVTDYEVVTIAEVLDVPVLWLLGKE